MFLVIWSTTITSTQEYTYKVPLSFNWTHHRHTKSLSNFSTPFTLELIGDIPIIRAKVLIDFHYFNIINDTLNTAPSAITCSAIKLCRRLYNNWRVLHAVGKMC